MSGERERGEGVREGVALLVGDENERREERRERGREREEERGRVARRRVDKPPEQPGTRNDSDI